MATVTLRGPYELDRALKKLAKQAKREVIEGMQRAGRYGVTAAVLASGKAKVRASGTYNSSWVMTRLSDGAVVSNAAAHAIFVELGRGPGKKPPLAPILEWVYQKRLAKRPKDGRRGAPTTDSPSPRKRGGGASRRKRAARKRHTYLVSDAAAFAELVRWKIAKRGTRARFILRRLVPKLGQRAHLESKRAIRRVTSAPPW